MPQQAQPPGELPVNPDLAERTGPAPAKIGRVRQVRQVRRVPRKGRWDVALVIAAGGALGGGARWALNTAWPSTPGGFPWATFLENVLGCLLLGALMVYLLEVWRPSRYARPFLSIGVLGGFTTFSAYTTETHGLLRAGQPPTAVIYLFGTLALALVATWAGLTLARTATGLNARRHRRSTP